MSNQHFYQDQNQKPAGPSRPADVGVLNQNKIDFPPPHEVADRAYTHYLNQGSQHGNDIEHWLNAESELLAERSRTRTHGYPNRK
jgi:hypothetical protein